MRRKTLSTADPKVVDGRVQERPEYAGRVYCSSEPGRQRQGNERLARERYQNPRVDKPNEGLLTDDCL